MRDSTTLLLLMIITLKLVTATNTVKMQRRTDTTQESSAKGVSVEQDWPLSEEFKAIPGGVLGFWGGV